MGAGSIERHSFLNSGNFDDNSEPVASLKKMGLKREQLNVPLEVDTVSLGGVSIDF